jgi:uncharacterized protein YukE
VSGAIVMPGGDPAMLEQMAARLETAAQGAGSLADSTSQVTADVRSAAQWTGDAADGYTAFTGNLATGVNGIGAPLARIAAAVREYAGSLRTAQLTVAAYATAVQNAQAAGNSPASLASAELAGQDAATAVAAQQTAGDQAAGTVRVAGAQLEDPFGPDGAVRAWIERVHVPWDSLAGDAVLGRYLAAAAGGREDLELAEEFAKGLPALMSGTFGEFVKPWMSALSKGEATEAELASALREFTSDYDAIGALNTAWKAGGGAALADGRLLGGIAEGSDLLAIGGDIYTEIRPEDSGAMAWVDRGAAGVNAAAAGLDGGYAIAGLIAGTTFEVPVVGEVALVGTGLYLGADYLYHHWTPFRDVANDTGHAIASTAKDAWHDVTSFF